MLNIVNIVKNSSIPSSHCLRDVNPLTNRLWLRLLSVDSIRLIGIFLINFSLWFQGRAREILTKALIK